MMQFYYGPSPLSNSTKRHQLALALKKLGGWAQTFIEAGRDLLLQMQDRQNDGLRPVFYNASAGHLYPNSEARPNVSKPS